MCLECRGQTYIPCKFRKIACANEEETCEMRMQTIQKPALFL